MRKNALFSFLIAIFTLSCVNDEEPLVSHLYGWVKQKADSTTGVNDIKLKIRDINPDDLSRLRIRETTTGTEDSLDGFFEMDSVCYGTTKMQGVGYVTIFVDSIDNPGWPSQYWHPNIYGPVDTIVIYITK